MKPGIEFMGIGAQKSATTWLALNLRKHPDVWIPPKKELHYFDQAETCASSSSWAEQKLLGRLCGRSPASKKFRESIAWDVKRRVTKRRKWREFPWLVRYYFAARSDEWYRSLFREGQGKVRGEITPEYALLGREDVQHIREMFPDLKVIFIMRNPIDRAWSQARFHWTAGKFSEIGDLDEVKKFIDSPRQTLRSDYLRTLDIWSSCFAENQMHVCFYDDVALDPRAFMRDVLSFLNVDDSIIAPVLVKQRVLGSREKQMPPEIERYLANKYHPELEKLTARVGGHAHSWLKTAEDILNGVPRERDEEGGASGAD